MPDDAVAPRLSRWRQRRLFTRRATVEQAIGQLLSDLDTALAGTPLAGCTPTLNQGCFGRRGHGLAFTVIGANAKIVPVSTGAVTAPASCYLLDMDVFVRLDSLEVSCLGTFPMPSPRATQVVLDAGISAEERDERLGLLDRADPSGVLRRQMENHLSVAS